VVTGGIGGWIIVKLRISKTNKISVPVYYQHGYGGGGPVTKGVIQTNRRAAYLPDAQVIITGHIHEEWSVTMCRDRLSKQGRTYHDEQVHICSATYKDEYDPPKSTWHSQVGRPLKPIGGTWLELTLCKEYDGTLQAEQSKGRGRLPLFKVAVNVRRAK
jgi:hypothetical protein